MVTTNLFLAKTNPQKTIWEHSDEVLSCYLSLKQLYPDAFTEEIWKAIETAIYCHDLGKMNYRFQNILYKSLKLSHLIPDVLKNSYATVGVDQIPHGILSLLFLDYERCSKLLGEEVARGILWAVCLHHNRQNLMKLLEEANFIAEIIREDLMNSIHGYFFKGDFILESPDENNHYLLDETQLTESSHWYIYARIKGVLNRADYAASGGLGMMEIDPLQNGKSIAQIVREKLPHLREVQEYMAERQGKNLIVIAATGIGKTEAALLWNGGQKMFYTLPLRVSINAIYERIKGKEKDGEKQGYWYSKAELLHSDALAYYLNEAKEQDTAEIDPFIRYQQARILAAPLTVCTVDQLFKFVFKCNGYEAMFATLTYSNVVIDEMQMYSPSIIACILYGLKLINDAGGRFAIITATFPKVLLKFFDELKIMPEIPEKLYYREDIGPRHRIALRQGEFDINELLAAARSKKVLVIVNTVRKAQTLYQKLSGLSDNLYIKLLHKNYIGRHRRKLEEEILAFAPGDYAKRSDNTPGIWICTQVVEASLDLDFDMLFTEMSIVDSILQRIGRCFRQRGYDGAEPNIIIYNTGNGIGYVYDRELYHFSLNTLQASLKDCDSKLFNENDKQKYIDQVYDPALNPDICNSKYYKEIKERLKILENLRPLALEQNEVDEKFRDIQSVNLIPEITYQELASQGKIDDWTRKFNKGGLKKEDRASLMTEIYDYVMNVRWHKGTDYKKKEELIFPGSGIYRSLLNYDFNNGRGLGLRMD